MSPARSRRRPPEHQPEGFGLLQIARAHAGDEEPSVLPPGRRDASGFWIPATCREPLELFTPHQRSLQERQRSLQRNRRTADAATCEAEGTTLPLPAHQTDAPAAPRTPTTSRPQAPPPDDTHPPR